MSTPHSDLQRFVTAQGSTYEQAVDELQNGQKLSHWMWFIFPQIAGLGHSANARYYAIRDLTEAEAYASHPVLGTRLLRCTEILLSLKNEMPSITAEDIFDEVDAQKLLSCVTLFSLTKNAHGQFQSVLNAYFNGELDERTVEIAATDTLQTQ